MDDLADVASKPLRIVFADLSTEYWLSDNTWLKHRNTAWQEGKADKVDVLQRAVMNEEIWIVESAWCFRGMQAELLACHQPAAIKFIIPTVQPAVLQEFIRQRCALQGKPFHDDYWQGQRLVYEGTLRHTNFANKHMRPAGVECFEIEIDAERKAWQVVLSKLKEWVC